MGVVQNLLILYTGVLLINVILAGVLWTRQRTVLFRNLFYVWSSMALSFVLQGAFAQSSHLAIILAFSSSFAVNLSLSFFFASVVSLTVAWVRFGILMAAGLFLGVSIGFYTSQFWAISLPIALCVAAPLLHTTVCVLKKRSDQLTTTGRVLAMSCLFFCLHNIDFAFLRDKPNLESLGFTIAILIVFALSISAPAVVLEQVAKERARIVELDRFKSRVFANLSHEFRTPLMMILAPTESLLNEDLGQLSEEQRGHLLVLRRNSLRLLKLINNLLDLARIEDHRFEIHPVRVQLSEFVGHIVGETKPLAARKNIALRFENRCDADDVFVDVEQFERVMINIIANALKFTEEGSVTVRVWTDPSTANVSITDTGPGIDPIMHERIFERFRQADPVGRKRYAGTGIGLAFSREIARLHGGDISVVSSVGDGSTFTVHLRRGNEHLVNAGIHVQEEPREEDSFAEVSRERRQWETQLADIDEYRLLEVRDATERRRVPRPTTDHPTHSKVLIVEDNLEVLNFIHLQLTSHHRVYVAQDGEQGLALAKRELPDLIITDYMMAPMDGLTMVKMLRQDQQTTDIPIIMVTAKKELEDRLQAREAGADVYLSKPFSPRELRAAVDQMLDRQGRQMARVMQTQVQSVELISAGLAHEIFNPLSYIRNSIFVLTERSRKVLALLQNISASDARVDMAIDLDKERDRVERMYSVAERGVKRIQQIGDLLRRVAREGFPEEKEDLHFDAAVKDVLDLIAPKDGTQIFIEAELKAGDTKVRCVPEEMHQVIRNLVQNALDVAEKHVVVSTRQIDGGVAYEVNDDGPGIDSEMQRKIFSPFFSTKDPGKGMGLGLTITQQVVQQCGGRVQIRSGDGLGGATFRVELPEAGCDLRLH